MPSFEQLVRKREGVRRKVYLDSLKKPTVGVGHLVKTADKLKVGDVVTNKQISDFFKVDGAKALSAAKTQAAKAGIRDANFIACLGSVNYQLGPGWTRKFKRAWTMIREGKYSDAAESLQSTRWFKQTPIRVKDFQRALLRLPEKKSTEGAR
jgi:GH24 family phage-related lysozyme (muramidase)